MQVYKALRRGVQEVAVKKLSCDCDEDLWLRLLVKESDVLWRVSHDRNVVQFYGACLQSQASAMLVMEFMAVRLRPRICCFLCEPSFPPTGTVGKLESSFHWCATHGMVP